jgi:SAM-dependent methyltransferase
MKPPIFDPAWPEDVRELYRHDMQELWEPQRVPHVYLQYQSQLSMYKKFANRPKLSILDVGCAQATLALQLAEMGHQVTALDMRAQFLEYARSRYTSGDIKFVCANVLEDPIEGRFDLIFANQIIEHLVYPAKMLERLRGLLSAGGRLIVTTPNAHYFRSELPTFSALGDPSQWEDRQFTADGDGHFFAYTKEELLELFRNAGFGEITGRFFETPFLSGHVKVRHFQRLLPVALLRALDRAALGVAVTGRWLAHQILVSGVAP